MAQAFDLTDATTTAGAPSFASFGGWPRFLAGNTTTKPAAPRFVVLFEAWAFLLPSLGDFLGSPVRCCLFYRADGSSQLFHRFISPNVHITVTEIFIPSILRA